MTMWIWEFNDSILTAMRTPDSIGFAATNLRAELGLRAFLLRNICPVHWADGVEVAGVWNLNFSPVWLHNLLIVCCQPPCGLSDCLG
jgi:hypothetical protein